MFDSKFFDNVSSKRILVTGDIMLDKFYYANLNKFSSDAPIPVAKIARRTSSPGGAANVARCISALGCSPLLAGFVGSDHNCESLLEQLVANKIPLETLVYSDHPTHTKIRVIAKNHQVFRLDFDDDTPYQENLFDKLISMIHDKLNRSLDALVLADYEKGVCTERFCQTVISDAHSHGTPVIVLPYGSNWIKYQHADFIVPNISKLNRILLSPVDPSDDDACLSAAHYVRRKFDIRTVFATRSQFGLTLASSGDVGLHFPTRKILLNDPAGAADASCAASSIAIANGSNLKSAALLSNIVGGIAVSKPGSYAPTVADVLEAEAG